MLHHFIAENQEEILARARARVAKDAGLPIDVELASGLPKFLGQLSEALQKVIADEAPDHDGIEASAGKHGDDLFHRGFSVAQVVRDYGALCQAITGAANDLNAPIAADEFQTLNLCLDDAIAAAVTEFARQREQATSIDGTERLGILAHELRNLLNTAVLAFASIKKGLVAPGGSTGAILDRSLTGLQMLVDRSLADVRLDAGMQNFDRVPVCELVEEAEVGASLAALSRGITLAVAPVDPTVMVRADRQVLAAAIANLIQNAFKFTRPGSTVSLRARAALNRVLIEVEDECGGLPESPADLLRPFTQQGRNRTGLGLGLSICMKAAKASSGELRIDDLPGKGCVFTIDLPKSA